MGSVRISGRAGVVVLAALAVAGLSASCAGAQDGNRKEKASKRMEQPATTKRETAVLAGGCFWCMEAIYQDLKGVEKVESGFSGGKTANPTYEQVCTGTTGHAEVVRVTFDPKVIAYADLLRIFFTVHDPTTLNRQGEDVGTQYRSAIFAIGKEQEKTAREVLAEVTKERIWPDPTVTEITPFAAFYPAEAYHRNYFRLNPDKGYCRIVIAPKVAKFREKYRAKLAR